MSTTVRGSLFIGVGFLCFGLGFLVGHGLDRSSPRSGPPDDSPILVTFEGGRITARELQARLDEQGSMLRQQLATPEGRRKLLQEMIRERLMMKAAEQKGYALDRRVQAEYRRALLDRFLQAELEEPLHQQPVSDPELEAFFTRHRDEYTRPERIRIAQLFLASKADAPDRPKRAEEARALLAELRRREAKDYYAFGTLAREKSEDPQTRLLGGELPFATRAELEHRLGKEVADAGFTSTRVGAVLDHVVESSRGFHLIKVLAKEDASDPSFAQLKEVLRPRFVAERREQERQKLLQSLEQQANIRIDDRALNEFHPAPGTAR